MNHKSLNLITIITALLIIITAAFSINDSQAYAITSTEKISFEDSHHDNKKSVTINYQPETTADMKLRIKSDQIDNIAIAELKQQLGDDNVKLDLNNQSIDLDLKQLELDDLQTSFKLSVKETRNIKVSIVNSKNKTIGEHEFKFKDEPKNNQTEADPQIAKSDEVSKNEPETSSNNPEPTPRLGQDWQRHNNLKVSTGVPTIRNGKQIIPVMYFGSLHYALSHLSVKSSVGSRDRVGADDIGKGRKNNISAANSAIIVAPEKNADLNSQRINDPNYTYYTTTFGDGEMKGHDSYWGSQRNFATTNIETFYASGGKKKLRPQVNGVDPVHTFTSTNRRTMDPDSAKFYVRQDPDTQLEMQKIVFNQTYDPIFGKTYSIQISITQKFLPDGSINIQTEFKNLANKVTHFTGFVFRDITFMKNSDFDGRDSKTKMLSLGNNEGIYASRDSNDGRIEFKLNDIDNEPYGWAGRGTASTFFKGEDDKLFPFAATKNPKYHDAFVNVLDTGDKTEPIPAGKQWLPDGTIAEKGISMHTGDKTLDKGKSIFMSYQTKLIEKTDDIQLRMYNDNPALLDEDDLNEFRIFGNWHHYEDRQVQIKYIVDSPDESPKYIAEKGTPISPKGYIKQNELEQFHGVLHDWEAEVPNLKKLSPGPHKISVVAFDTHNHYSVVKPVNIVVPDIATDVPRIKIDTPKETSEEAPFETYNNLINIEGNWSDKDSKELTLTYSVDNGPEKNLDHILNNHGQNTRFKLHDFNFQRLDKSKTHSIRFTIKDENNPPQSDTFYFKHKDGPLELIHPGKISFGNHHLVPGQSKKVKPTLDNRITLIDYRGLNSSPLDLTLTIDELKTQDNRNLNYNLQWDNSPVKPHEVLTIHKKIVPKQNQWITVTTINDFEKKLRLKFKKKAHETGLYKSKWLWNFVDSV
ncbi:hypothetical protein [Companilactobacillus furfuricola]|uniref:hypothetical protein n=1 Tax=Companilactobacillus furfuricola TaxID=1462575 RepID=UPI000F7795F5|nr:hypothetical protein [Companilactobacillus furfuricola]